MRGDCVCWLRLARQQRMKAAAALDALYAQLSPAPDDDGDASPASGAARPMQTPFTDMRTHAMAWTQKRAEIGRLLAMDVVSNAVTARLLRLLTFQTQNIRWIVLVHTSSRPTLVVAGSLLGGETCDDQAGEREREAYRCVVGSEP